MSASWILPGSPGSPRGRAPSNFPTSRLTITASPPEPVAATLILNALYYAEDRAGFLRHVASYTTRKIVFDFNPRTEAAAAVERDLRAAGLELAARRAYLVPQSLRLPRPAAAALRRLEPIEPLAALVLRLRGQWLYAAVPR